MKIPKEIRIFWLFSQYLPNELALFMPSISLYLFCSSDYPNSTFTGGNTTTTHRIPPPSLPLASARYTKAFKFRFESPGASV
eukprot:NODE_502_length_783_cov_125.120427_g493_i0.p1 GENE.NODE_502_length_783_cov_125.120427_g493_i0~~NODE_502_length_783_cov_125.120427_g493_i0.p1  ORF type:complete len:82 (-),score=4.94 NODE_502_length_783_cov_125.120427_g493_i0:208-453(-)